MGDGISQIEWGNSGYHKNKPCKVLGSNALPFEFFISKLGFFPM